MKTKITLLPTLITTTAPVIVYSGVYLCVAMAYGTLDFTCFGTIWQYILLFSGIAIWALLILAIATGIMIILVRFHDEYFK